MKNINNIIISLLAIFFLFSCFEDKGNYDYKKINKVEISGIENSYYLSVGDTLLLEPEVSFTLENSKDLTYEWILNMDKVLSNDKNISFVIPDTSSKIERLLLRVTDNETGVKAQMSTSLIVSQLFSQGWLLLSEKDGKSSLDFIKATYTEEGYEYKDYFEVYKTAENEDLGSEPLRIHEHWRYRNNDPGHILVVQRGGQGCVDLFGGNLRKSLETVKEFTQLPANYDPKDVLFATNFSYILNSDGKVFSRRNFISEAYYSGYFSDYPVGFDDNGEFKELNVDRFIRGFDHMWKYYFLAYEKVNKRFIGFFDYKSSRYAHTSGSIFTLNYSGYPEGYIPLHNIGDNELFYSMGHKGRTSSSYKGLYNIYKTPDGKYIEQQIDLKFSYKSLKMTIKPIEQREFPAGFIDENSVVDVPDSGNGASTFVFISKGNKIYYYDRKASGDINLSEYHTFESDVVAMDDLYYRNDKMCVCLVNGDVFIMDITASAISGMTEKIEHKVGKSITNVKHMIYKNGSYAL